MNTTSLTSRRAVLKGLPVAVAAMALPAVAFASPAATIRSAVLDAIAAHKAAWREIRRCNRMCERLCDTPGYPPLPRVQIGRLLGQMGDDGERTWTPIWAYNHKEISKACDQWVHAQFGGEAGAERYRQRFARDHRTLTRLIRARLRFERSIGLPQAEAAETAAYEAEQVAVARLVLARPMTAAEAEAKRRYFKRAALRLWWEATSAPKLVRDLSCELA